MAAFCGEIISGTGPVDRTHKPLITRMVLAVLPPSVLQLVRLFRQLQLIRLFKHLEVRQRLKRVLAAEESAAVLAPDGAAAQQRKLAAAEAEVMAKYSSTQSRVGQRLSGG